MFLWVFKGENLVDLKTLGELCRNSEDWGLLYFQAWSYHTGLCSEAKVSAEQIIWILKGWFLLWGVSDGRDWDFKWILFFLGILLMTHPRVNPPTQNSELKACPAAAEARIRANTQPGEVFFMWLCVLLYEHHHSNIFQAEVKQVFYENCPCWQIQSAVKPHGEESNPPRAKARGRLLVSCQRDFSGYRKYIKRKQDRSVRNTSTGLHPLLSALSSRPISPSRLTPLLRAGDKQCRGRVSRPATAWRKAIEHSELLACSLTHIGAFPSFI